MSKLREKTIQSKALEFLKAHYANKFSINSDSIDCKDERWTKKTSGGKRADGLICFEREGKPYTISLEAKSHRTLNALISSYNDEKLFVHSLIVSSIMTLTITLAIVFYTDMRWYFTTLIATVALVVLFFVAAVIYDMLDLNSHRAIGVINQLKQYPANEQWIAYSKYTDNLLLNTSYNRKRNNTEILERLCKDNKFGLLLVTNKDCEIRVHPSPKRGEFLHHYCQEQEILKTIAIRS